MSTQPKDGADGNVVSGAAHLSSQQQQQQQQTQQQQQQKQKQPVSLYARKLLQKLSTLHPSASLESRQAIASWIIFNRKKCDAMGEGLLVSILECSSDGGGKSVDAEANVARLMLLLNIVHQVIMSNCPTITASSAAGAAAAANPMMGVGTDDVDAWKKSTQLRIRLGEIVVIPLWKTLAMALNRMHETTTGKNRDAYQDEIESMLEEWKEHDVFGGPTVWEEYKRAWNRALKEESMSSLENERELHDNESTNLMNSATESKLPEIASSTKEENDVVDTMVLQGEVVINTKKDAAIKNDENEKVDTNNNMSSSDDVDDTHDDMKNDTYAVESTKRESVANIMDVEVDFEGVEEAKVEPTKFLDACKVIASLQITRDLGSDAAMNLSSVLSSIPSDVVEACNIILTQQKNGQDKITPITDLLSTESLTNLPDDVLDMDLNYVRQSLQSYKEAIRQQRLARVQLLHMLLQSRCSFGSMDAARSFRGCDNSDVSMDAILEQLKKRKETLVDAMALEGLDVEEDEEEKKLAVEETELIPLSWFPGGDKDAEKEPADKKLKTC